MKRMDLETETSIGGLKMKCKLDLYSMKGYIPCILFISRRKKETFLGYKQTKICINETSSLNLVVQVFNLMWCFLFSASHVYVKEKIYHFGWIVVSRIQPWRNTYYGEGMHLQRYESSTALKCVHIVPRSQCSTASIKVAAKCSHTFCIDYINNSGYISVLFFSGGKNLSWY